MVPEEDDDDDWLLELLTPPPPPRQVGSTAIVASPSSLPDREDDDWLLELLTPTPQAVPRSRHCEISSAATVAPAVGGRVSPCVRASFVSQSSRVNLQDEGDYVSLDLEIAHPSAVPQDR